MFTLAAPAMLSKVTGLPLNCLFGNRCPKENKKLNINIRKRKNCFFIDIEDLPKLNKLYEQLAHFIPTNNQEHHRLP
jgi:hypothetical protein